jgi:alpha,alpha-trehalase
MPNMETKVLTLKELLLKGEFWPDGLPEVSLTCCSFGWVNASYVYGLQITNAHMQRALGALIPYEKFMAATEQAAMASLHI